MVVLIVISIALLVWGSIVGFESNDGRGVDAMLYWAYIMVGIALVSWVIVGGIISAKNNPKSLIKAVIVLVGLVVICFVAYLLAPANPAFGREGEDTHTVLKLTDTILNLTYFAGGVAILSIIIGEIRLAITNKK